MSTDQQANRNDLIAILREQTRNIVGNQRSDGAEVTSTGCEALNRLLPDNGLRRGTLVEWHGYGAASLSLVAARQSCATGGALVVVDPTKTFYAQAASALGIDLNRLIVTRPDSPQDATWAIDQALRCEAVAVVWAFVDRLDARLFRRLQLSAEIGNGLGFFIRSKIALNEPTWSAARLLVQPQSARGRSPRFRVQVAHSQGGPAGGSGLFEIDDTTGLIQGVADETHLMSVASQLAHATPAECQADIA